MKFGTHHRWPGAHYFGQESIYCCRLKATQPVDVGSSYYILTYLILCRLFNMFQVVASQVAYFVYCPWLCGTEFPVKTNWCDLTSWWVLHPILYSSAHTFSAVLQSPVWRTYLENRNAGLYACKTCSPDQWTKTKCWIIQPTSRLGWHSVVLCMTHAWHCFLCCVDKFLAQDSQRACCINKTSRFATRLHEWHCWFCLFGGLFACLFVWSLVSRIGPDVTRVWAFLQVDYYASCCRKSSIKFGGWIHIRPFSPYHGNLSY